MTASHSEPVRYRPEVETPEDDEADTIRELEETLRAIADKTFEDGGHGMRSVHAKSHGLVRGEVVVEEGLPPELAQGLFASPGRYPAIVRFSTSPGDPLDDTVSLPRGMSVKLLGVTGETVPVAGANQTQDFVLINGPAFLKPTAKAFLRSLKLLAKTTDRAEGLKKALSAVLRGTEKVIEAVGGESGELKAMGGHPQTHILGERFFTQAPVRFGDYIAKLSMAPVAPSLTALTDRPIEDKGRADALREDIAAYFDQHDGEWEVRAQLCRDLDTMPVEDASVVWPEDTSPYVKVATLRVPKQSSYSLETDELDQRLSFNPWHALRAHQPLGSIMRARRHVYETMAKHRAAQNRSTLVEPSSLDELPWRQAVD